MNFFSKYISHITALCKKHKVRKLFAFGSVLTDQFNEDSDIDLIVDFEDVDLKDYVDNYFDLQEELCRMFNRPIDLLEDKAIRNPILRNKVDATKILIYG